MKDNEIVQALRCCAKGLGHDDACENCKVGEIQDRREYTEFAAANVIERLTAENAELRKEIEWKDMVISLAQREQAKALDAADAIARLRAENAALREKQRWVPVTERLPEKQAWYHVAIRDKKTMRVYVEQDLYAVETAKNFGHEIGFCKANRWPEREELIAWMPFPEAPKGGEPNA